MDLELLLMIAGNNR